MTRPLQPCLSCGGLQRDGSRHKACQAAHQRARDLARGTPHERGYDAEYRRLRRLILSVPQRCWWCGGRADTIDHLLPIAHGGRSVEGNLVPACRDCNLSRGSNLDWRPSRTPRPAA